MTLQTVIMPMEEDRKSQQEGTCFQETYRITGSLVSALFINILSTLIVVGIYSLIKEKDEKTTRSHEIANTITNSLMAITEPYAMSAAIYVNLSVFSSTVKNNKPWKFENIARKTTYAAFGLLGALMVMQFSH